jgi:hypothetical protein
LKIVLISNAFGEVRTSEGEDLNEALASFKSSVWQQGYYGDWRVYVRSTASLDLEFKGFFIDLI